jgi:hypothetical protein
MPTSQRANLLAACDHSCITQASSLLTLANLPPATVADPFGYAQSHAVEWQHAAPTEPHKQAYAPAWIHLSLILWQAHCNGPLSLAITYGDELSGSAYSFPWAHPFAPRP